MLALALALASTHAHGQPSDVPGPDEPDRTSQGDRQPAKPEFKVVFWYEQADPTNTLKAKVYDLRTGRYDQAAVKGWFKMVSDDFPGYRAFERDVVLGSEPGDTEEAKLEAAIERERKQVLGARTPQGEHRRIPRDEPSRTLRRHEQATSEPAYRPSDLSKLLHPGGTPAARGFDGGNGSGMGRFRGSPGDGRSFLPPPSPSFPTPYPYPRPHP